MTKPTAKYVNLLGPLVGRHAPLIFWYYALEYLEFLRNHIAKPKLGNKTPFEAVAGAIPDISKCRFTFWQPIWFYTPLQERMLPARFLGLSKDSGDAFTFIIAVEPTNVYIRFISWLICT